jgi:hypothetical protein
MNGTNCTVYVPKVGCVNSAEELKSFLESNGFDWSTENSPALVCRIKVTFLSV